MFINCLHFQGGQNVLKTLFMVKQTRGIAQDLCNAPMRFMFIRFYRQRRAFLIAPKASRRKHARQPALRPKGQSVPKRDSWA